MNIRAYDEELTEKIRAERDTDSFCDSWESEYRVIAVMAQNLLRRFLPVAADVLGLMIEVVDASCKIKNK